jgi:tryptophan synthase alpha chain
MNKIDTQFQKIKKSGKIGLMTHVVVGYPTIDITVSLIETLAKAGSDYIELQIPFSDPIADGPTIMQACDVALKNGVTVETAFEIAEKAVKKVEIPLLFMGYYNTVFAYGVEKFCKRSKEMGISGFIFPDVPPEEESYENLITCCEKYGLHLIRVISPASSDERLRINAQVAKGFIYCISRYGVTGAQSNIDVRLSEYLSKVRSFFDIPVAVGFGISSVEHVKALKKDAHIAVVGSKIINIVDENKELLPDEILEKVEEFVKSLKI